MKYQFEFPKWGLDDSTHAWKNLTYFYVMVPPPPPPPYVKEEAPEFEWTLVRRIAPKEHDYQMQEWHPASDSLKGTACYGEPVGSTE